MKRFLIAIISGYIFLSLNGCTSLLEENPTDRFVTDNFYSSESDAEAAVNAIYEQLYGLYNRNMYMLCDLTADNMKNGMGMANQYLQELEFLSYTSENTFITGMWQNNYSGISRANTAIANIPQINMNKTLQNRLMSEAYFLRALFYFNLVRFFGEVPIILQVKSVSDAVKPRDPVDKVYEQIIADLTEAEKYLLKTYLPKDAGRVTQGAAKILLGKVYLTKKDYANAISKLAEVIEHETEFGYGLHPQYAMNWQLSSETGKEAVFYLEFMEPPASSNTAMGLAGPKSGITGGQSALGIGELYEADIPTVELYNTYKNTDSRKYTVFKMEYISLKTGKIHTATLPLFGKYWQDGINTSKLCAVNTHVIRYADALLMYAEALNELDRTSDALQVLNRIVERAYGNNSENYANLDKDQFRDAVAHERQLELAYEGHRWFDLVRTGKFVQRMKEHSAYEASIAEKNKTDIADNIQDYMVLMPIPQREMDLNPALTQNKGWDGTK